MSHQDEVDSYIGSWHDGSDFWRGFLCNGIIGFGRVFGVWLGGGLIVDGVQRTFWKGEMSDVPLASIVLGQAIATALMASCAWFSATRIKDRAKHYWYSVLIAVAYIPREMPHWSWPLFTGCGFVLWWMFVKLAKRIRSNQRGQDTLRAETRDRSIIDGGGDGV